MQLEELRKQLRNFAIPERAKSNARFFKTEEGQYGYGDKFLGVTVPDCRKVVKQYGTLGLLEIEQLLASEFHEERLTGLLILVSQFKKADEVTRKTIFDFYLKHLKAVNNWDLVDLSAPNIVGTYLFDKKITLLLAYAKTGSLWEKRIAMVSTLAFIVKGNGEVTFRIADLMLDERLDLLQKAVGWMLREVGKRVSQEKLESYLAKSYKKMGRTSLRYAIERFDEKKRKAYLAGTV